MLAFKEVVTSDLAWILARRLMLVFVEVRNIGYGSWFLARRLMLAFNESVTSDLDRGSWPED